MFVDLLQLLLHLDGEVDQVAAVSELVALKSNIDTRYKMVLMYLLSIGPFCSLTSESCGLMPEATM